MTPGAASQHNIPALPTGSEVISEDAYLDLAYQLQRAARLQNSAVSNGTLSIPLSGQGDTSGSTDSTGSAALPLSSPAVPEPVAVRELTQTDRLNNQLINAFLSRINTSQPNAQESHPEEVDEFEEKEEDIVSNNR